MIGQKFEGISDKRIAEVWHDGNYKTEVSNLGRPFRCTLVILNSYRLLWMDTALYNNVTPW